MKDEVTLREATVFTIDKSQEEFKRLKDNFRSVSEAFDSGRDQDGLALLKEKVIPQVSSFYEFCFTLIHAFDDVLDAELLESLSEKYQSLDTLMKSLTRETETGNFTEVGDILRFDFTDLINEFSAIFPKVSAGIKSSDCKDLDTI